MTRVSQSGIEEIIERYFGGKRDGFFVEVGAWDGEHISQTAWLERERGWRGACFEPFPHNFHNRTCQVASLAISGDGLPREYVAVTRDRRNGGDVSYLSGFKDSLSAHWNIISEHCDYETMQLPTMTFEQAARFYLLPRHIDFLSLDTEGSEVEILRGIDLSRFSFGMICVEHNQSAQVRRMVADLLAPPGYTLYAELLLDDVYVGA